MISTIVLLCAIFPVEEEADNLAAVVVVAVVVSGEPSWTTTGRHHICTFIQATEGVVECDAHTIGM